jgi:Tfp pilus assembly ATPase PilU
MKLLKLILRQRATELRLLAGTQPVIVIRNEPHPAARDAMSGGNIKRFLNGIATAAQLKELEICGDVHFIYAFRAVRFAVRATLKRDKISVKVRNLTSGSLTTSRRGIEPGRF